MNNTAIFYNKQNVIGVAKDANGEINSVHLAARADDQHILVPCLDFQRELLSDSMDGPVVILGHEDDVSGASVGRVWPRPIDGKSYLRFERHNRPYIGVVDFYDGECRIDASAPEDRAHMIFGFEKGTHFPDFEPSKSGITSEKKLGKALRKLRKA